jgi:ribosomal protein S27AE
MEGNVEKDPLEELREADRWMSKKFYDRIADAWQTERERHQSLVDSMASSLNECAAKTYVMQGRLDSLPEVADLRDKLDTLQSCYDADLEAHKEEVVELQAKLDASIQLPLDADGVPCRIGDLLETEEHIPRKVVGYYLADESTPCVTLDFVSPSIEASRLHHVAPKLPDSQERIDADVEKSACEYFGRPKNCNIDPQERTCHNSAPHYLRFRCSECHYVIYHDDANETGEPKEDGIEFCPHCGARVIGDGKA